MRAHVNTALAIPATKLPLLHEMEEKAGEGIPRRDSRFAPLNRPLSGLRHPLPLRGGEGKGEGAVSNASRFKGRRHVQVESGAMVTLSRSFVAGEGEALGCRALKARELHALNSRFPIHGPLVFNIPRA
jgi:hypothetical protein